MEIKGKLKAIQPLVEKSNFKSRKIWLTTEDNPTYPQTIEIEVQQDKADMFANVAIGAEVNCHINLRGREWTGADGVVKVFNSLVCWKVDGVAYTKPAEAATPSAPLATVTTGPVLDDSLPF